MKKREIEIEREKERERKLIDIGLCGVESETGDLSNQAKSYFNSRMK